MKVMTLCLCLAWISTMIPVPAYSAKRGTLSALNPSFNETQEDSWLGMDKFLHVAACASITGLSYHVYHCQYRNPVDRSIYLSLSLAGTSGIGKEVYDARIRKTRWSWKDIVADGVGIAIGYLLFIHFDT